MLSSWKNHVWWLRVVLSIDSNKFCCYLFLHNALVSWLMTWTWTSEPHAKTLNDLSPYQIQWNRFLNNLTFYTQFFLDRQVLWSEFLWKNNVNIIIFQYNSNNYAPTLSYHGSLQTDRYYWNKYEPFIGQLLLVLYVMKPFLAKGCCNTEEENFNPVS